MNDASDYLALVKALILSNPLIVHWTILREEAQESAGLLRYRLVQRFH
ncbi:MAG: hypothetical protein IPK16_29790, partial [Anaerolineales bacterium]|nr:hypothetical protein [Anaerolineales bacterium]